MKNLCSAVSLVILLALFANAQEAPSPLPNDSSLAVTQDSSLAVAKETSVPVQEISLPVALPVTKAENKTKEKNYEQNLRVVAYLHPLALFFGAANNMLMFNSTFEIPFSLGNSVVVQPAVWLGSSDGYLEIFDAVKYEKLKRIGGGIGLRHYVVDRGQGFYLQATANAYYISAESISLKENYDDDGYYSWEYEVTTWEKVKGVVGELMLYIGAAHKWQNVGFFYESGLGLGYDRTKTYQLGYINKLVASFNVGVGIPF